MNEEGWQLTETEKTKLRVKLAWFREWQQWLRSIPDQEPVMRRTIRPKGSSNLFIYRLPVLNCEELTRRWFHRRNKTFKRNFAEYVSQLYSILIAAEVQEDGTLNKESVGVELYSPDLKKINRNYADFNKVLFRDGWLDLLEVHDADEKKCRKYAAPLELCRKGIEKVFLSEEEKARVIKSIRVSTKPDTTKRKLNAVCQYYVGELKRTKISTKALEHWETELGKFRELYPRVVRHQAGKFDLKINAKEGRLYSIYLYAPKIFRRFMRWKGKHEMIEGDVAASHFHFLLAEMTDAKEREQMKRDLVSSDPYPEMCSNPAGVSREELKASSHKFKYGSRSKKHRKRMTDYDWFEQRMKKQNVLYRQGVFFRHLAKKYPRFAETMAAKRIFGYKQRSRFSCEIMRREAKVMVQLVGRQCMAEKLVYLPIHDGFLTLPKHYDRVCEVIADIFQREVGSVPKIRRK